MQSYTVAAPLMTNQGAGGWMSGGGGGVEFARGE